MLLLFFTSLFLALRLRYWLYISESAIHCTAIFRLGVSAHHGAWAELCFRTFKHGFVTIRAGEAQQRGAGRFSKEFFVCVRFTGCFCLWPQIEYIEMTDCIRSAFVLLRKILQNYE